MAAGNSWNYALPGTANPTWDRFLAFAWEGEAGQRLLATVNYGPTQGQCHVAWPFVDMKGKKVTLKDLMHEARYEWEGDALLYRGLYVDLPAWGFHIFDCRSFD